MSREIIQKLSQRKMRSCDLEIYWQGRNCNSFNPNHSCSQTKTGCEGTFLAEVFQKYELVLLQERIWSVPSRKYLANPIHI